MIDAYNSAVGARIRECRELMHLTREKFAEHCDISDSFLADIELGKKSLTVKTLHKICSNLKISPNYIVFGAECEDTSAVTSMLSRLDEKQLRAAADILAAYIRAME